MNNVNGGASEIRDYLLRQIAEGRKIQKAVRPPTPKPIDGGKRITISIKVTS